MLPSECAVKFHPALEDQDFIRFDDPAAQLFHGTNFRPLSERQVGYSARFRAAFEKTYQRASLDNGVGHSLFVVDCWSRLNLQSYNCGGGSRQSVLYRW